VRTDRRTALGGLGGLALLAGAPFGTWARAAAADAFVRREGIHLLRGEEPYRIVGANMWYAAWLGADAAYGDRARLGRELDRLQRLGINNLRIMAAAEEGPLRNSIKPGFSRPDGTLNPDLLGGLDFALAEIAQRGMTAVVCLGNFWEWSGGFETWLYRVTGQYMDMNDPAHPWPAAQPPRIRSWRASWPSARRTCGSAKPTWRAASASSPSSDACSRTSTAC